MKKNFQYKIEEIKITLYDNHKLKSLGEFDNTQYNVRRYL